MSLVGLILTVAVIGGGVWVFQHPPGRNRASNEAKKLQMEPDDALNLYLKTVYKFKHNEAGGTYAHLKAAVVPEDWAWLQENEQIIFSSMDRFSVGGVIAADQQAAVSKRLAVEAVINGGPKHPNDEVLGVDDRGNELTYTLRETDGLGGYTDYKIDVVKRDGVWKVRGFGGGRERVEMMINAAKTEK